MAHVVNNTGNQEHYTPPYLVEMARIVMGGIDLDPASNEIAQKWIRAKKYYSKENSGLKVDWKGNVWLNPPYSRGLLNSFIEKLIVSSVDQYVVLINNTTETVIGQKLIRHSNAICFPAKRIRFVKPDETIGKSPLQGQMIAYRGNNRDLFMSIFEPIGAVLINNF